MGKERFAAKGAELERNVLIVAETILDVCDGQNVPLPRLCHLEGLGDIGACRLCLVEVEGSNKLAPACLTKAEEGTTFTVTIPVWTGA